MTRKKVKLAYIANDSARKATFKKRKKGMMKKVSELSTLCGIDACAIIYSPYDNQPEVWPSSLGVQRVLAQFKKMPEMEQSKKMVNQESFLRQRITKGREQLKKQEKETREKEMTHLMYQCLVGKGSLQHLNVMDLTNLDWLIEQNLKDIQNRSDALKKGLFSPHFGSTAGESSAAAAAGGGGGLVLNPVMATHNNQHQDHDYDDEKPLPQHHLSYSYEPPTMNTNNVDALQRQQWFMDLINSTTTNIHHQMGASVGVSPAFAGCGGGGEDHGIIPFGDNINNNISSNNNNNNNNNNIHNSNNNHAAGLWSNAFFGWNK